MIFKCAGKIAEFLCAEDNDKKDMQELYQYAIFSIISTVIPILIAAVTGAMLGRIKNGMLMILPLFTIRKFSGGFHARREWVCMVSSVAVIAGCTILTTYCKADIWMNIGLIISIFTIFQLSPVVSENRDIPQKVRNICRKTAFIFTVLFVISYFILVLCGYSQYAVCIGIGIFLTAFLQDLAFIQKIIS